MLVAVFEAVSQKLLYLNGTGRSWLDPNGDAELGSLDMVEVLGVKCHESLKNTILPHTIVLGRWAGDCELRDVWGSESAVKATFTAHNRLEGHPTPLICLQAVKTGGGGFDDLALGDRELLHALLDSTPELIYFKDQQSRMIRVSQSMARKMGVAAPSDLIGRTDFDFFTVEHARPAYENEQGIVRTGSPILDCEEKETWPDGHCTWVSTSKLPLRNRNGRIVGTFGISRDITALKISEQQQRELETQLLLAQKLESVGRLAAGIAHEINTPTQFITDNVHFLTSAFNKIASVLAAYRTLAKDRAGTPLDDDVINDLKGREAAAEIEYHLDEIPKSLVQSLEGLGRIARIVGSLKEFSHPSNAIQTAANLQHAIENAITVSRHEWKYVAQVVTEFDPASPLVPCVVDEFNQVMLNLLVNAAHAIASGQAASGNTQLGTITVRTSHDSHWATIEVADTGVGIPESIRHRIFEPFFTTKGVGKGTGQGLTLVHTIIVMHHGGSVDFTSEVGCGTTFKIRLPLRTQTSSPASP